MADVPHDLDSSYEATPPWDVGHPQPAFLALGRSGALAGPFSMFDMEQVDILDGRRARSRCHRN